MVGRASIPRPVSIPHLAFLLDAHGHEAGGHAAHGPEGHIAHQIEGNVGESKLNRSDSVSDVEDQRHRALDSAMTQIIGVAILEFGVTLHRYVCHVIPLFKRLIRSRKCVDWIDACRRPRLQGPLRRFDLPP